MAISYVQGESNTAHSATSVSAAFTAANTAGNLIIVCLGAWNGASTVGTPVVSDSAGNTYTQLTTDGKTGAGTSLISVWYALNVKAGSNTVTINGLISGTDLDITVVEYSGVASVAASSFAVAGATTVSTSVTPSNASDLMLLFGYDQTNAGDTFTFTSSPSESFTQRQSTSNAAGGESSALADCNGGLPPSAITVTANISAGSSHALYVNAILLSVVANAPSSRRRVICILC